VAKPSLGRGLGDLMQGTQVAGARPQVPGAPTGSEEVNIAPGLRSILRGGKPTEAVDLATAPTPTHARRTRLIQGSLIGADVLLSGLAMWIVFKRTTPLGLSDASLCFAALALGAWLSCLAVMLDRESD
jgi:hypothetical protein